jgi:hypothetical protein
VARALLVALPLALAADAVSAALKKFSVRRTSLSVSDFTPIEGRGDAIVETNGSAGVPRLVRLEVATDLTQTCCGGGSLSIFVSLESREGPSPNQVGTGNFTSGIAWGSVTGWTISGSFFCKSSPEFLCTIVSGINLTTVDPPLRSPFYDLGTWTFHGTGFTATAFIHEYFTSPYADNAQWILRGRQQERFLPLLSTAALTAVAAGLLAGGARRARQTA